MSNVPVIVTEALLPGEVERLRADMLAWEPDHDDRTRPLLLAEAGRREASDWGGEDAENVIAFLLSRLDEAFARHRIAATSTLQEQVERLRAALEQAIVSIEKGGLDDRMCCDGHECGCYGSSNADWLIYCLSAALTQKDIPDER